MQATDMDTLEQVRDTLKPFYDITILMSGESYSTLSLVHPLLNKLSKSLELSGTESNITKLMKEAIASDLDKRSVMV